jgi:hypothetical protein
MMTNFERGHESGHITPVPDPEIITQEPHETCAIPPELQGMPVNIIVKGIRSLRFAEKAELS